MNKVIILLLLFTLTISLFASDYDFLIEKLLNDMNKNPNTILQENSGSTNDGFDEFGQLWIRSRNYRMLNTGFQWGFAGNVCWRIIYSAVNNENTINQVIEAISNVFGFPETNLNEYKSWPKRNDRSILFMRGNDSFIVILQRQQESSTSNNNSNSGNNNRSTWSPQNSVETGEQVAVMATYTREQMARSTPEMRVNATGGLSWQIGSVGGETINSFLEYNANGRLIKYYILLPYSESRLIFLVESGGKSRNDLPRQRSNGDRIDLGIVYRNNTVEISCTIVLELTPAALRNLGGSGPEYVRPEYNVRYLN